MSRRRFVATCALLAHGVLAYLFLPLVVHTTREFWTGQCSITIVLSLLALIPAGRRCPECRRRTPITFASADNRELCSDCWFRLERPKLLRAEQARARGRAQ